MEKANSVVAFMIQEFELIFPEEFARRNAEANSHKAAAEEGEEGTETF